MRKERLPRTAFVKHFPEPIASKGKHNVTTADLPPEDGHQNVACLQCTGERTVLHCSTKTLVHFSTEGSMHKEPAPTQGFAKQGLVSSGTEEEARADRLIPVPLLF